MESHMTAHFHKGTEEAPSGTYLLERYEIASVENLLSSGRPAITFKCSQVYVNGALLKCVPEMMYALFLIDRAERKLILHPCEQWDRSAVRLGTLSQAASKPRHVRATEFCRQLFAYMQWDAGYSYRATGDLVDNNGEAMIVFDLATTEALGVVADGNVSVQKSLDYGMQISSCFGPTTKERRTNPMVAKFAQDIEVTLDNPECAKRDTVLSDSKGMDAEGADCGVPFEVLQCE